MPESKWPKEAFSAILRRKGRMPRNGWGRMHKIFCDKFHSSISINDFREKAKQALIVNDGKRCSTKEFKEESFKRQKTLSEFIEERSLFEAKINLETKKIFYSEIQGQ